ncbi:MAG: carboxylesterase [miscellaneous Crenarchaeota group-6 archaeon AD8-1]|nr:MAG: carboxylesterase [miscellaneous Crenarchaeota group-6 archaeon AD8-1]
MNNEKKPIIVNVDNFVRAETNKYFDRTIKQAGGLNTWIHLRQPTPIDKQTVIRMNRDTLYSSAIVDISKGAKIIMPDAKDRYMSIMIVNQNHYINKVYHGGGTYQLTMEEFETFYVMVAVRTLVNSSDPEDLKKVNALQDQMKIEAVSSKPFVLPDYDMESYKKTRNALLELGRGVSDVFGTFGKKEEVNPIRHLIGTALGWGGLPVKEVVYENVEPNLPVGKYQITIKDVPADAFWSVSLYNENGFFQKNDLDAYNINSTFVVPNKDGSFTINFGGCGDGRVNCLPIMEGWNYVVRYYRPRKEVIEGKYKFPKPKPAP